MPIPFVGGKYGAATGRVKANFQFDDVSTDNFSIDYPKAHTNNHYASGGWCGGICCNNDMSECGSIDNPGGHDFYDQDDNYLLNWGIEKLTSASIIQLKTLK